MNKKLLLSIVLLIVAGLVFLILGKNNETEDVKNNVTATSTIDVGSTGKIDWKSFEENGYGYSLKYPPGWVVGHTKKYGRLDTEISFNRHSIIIIEIDPAVDNINGGTSFYGQDEYHSIHIEDFYVMRPIKEEVYEANHQRYLPLCFVTKNTCKSAIKLGNRYFGISYITENNIAFDSTTLLTMDSIVSTLKYSVK